MPFVMDKCKKEEPRVIEAGLVNVPIFYILGCRRNVYVLALKYSNSAIDFMLFMTTIFKSFNSVLAPSR